MSLKRILSQPNLETDVLTQRKKSKNADEDDSIISPDGGRAGRILRIYLKNFMCHSSLEIKFNPNTNYLIGRNGSGKSAILTALIIGLGGKARDTNRGANMKAFIKVGQNLALIEITLSNTGAMAYNPRVFGNEIIITRTFSDSGTNTYKLKSSTGVVVSSTFRDVNRLIDALNIHVDNPVCILNQDTARTFLNTSDPLKLYIMFMKATNLEFVKAQYKAALRNKQETSTILSNKEKSLDELKEEVMKWLKKFQSLDRVNEIEDKKKALEIEAVWSQINCIETELEERNERVEEITKELNNLEDMVQNKTTRRNQLTEDMERARQQLIEIRNEEEMNQEAMNAKKAHLNRLKEYLITKSNEITSIENIIKRRLLDFKNIEEEINNSSTNQTNRIKLLEERDAQLAVFQRRHLEISKLLETAENDVSQIRSALARKNMEKNNIDQDLEHNVGKIRQRQAKIRTMKLDENNAINVYGGHMQRVLDSINASKEQFKHLPRGPIGLYIKLKDRQWALAIEDYIGSGTLTSFCVDNHEDAKVLTKIFQEVCPSRSKPTIICSQYLNKIHNYSGLKVEVPNSCVAMIDAMTIKDPVIANCLIDQLSIETVLLIPTSELAMNMMSQESRVPKNCTRAVTLKGDQFYPDPNYRSYSCKNTNPRFLQVSAAEAIRIYEDELQTLLENNKSVEIQNKAITDDVARLTQELSKIQLKISKLYTAQTRAQTDMNDMKLQQLPPEPNIEILTEELGEIKTVINNKEKEIQDLRDNLKTIQDQIKNAEDECNNFKQLSKGLEERMKPIIDQLNECESSLKQINISSKYQADKIKQSKAKLVEAKNDYEDKKKIFEEKLKETQQLGPRMKNTRELETVITELKEVKEQLLDVRTTIGDRLVITQTYMRLQERYNKTKADVDKVHECLHQVAKSVESRARHYQQLIEYIGIRVREMFAGVLKLRQFKGTIEIDHEKQQLSLVVIPQHSSSQGSSGRTHILSGGERSYSTVAFLHALWQVMQYPFYFLDEFDVFMDKVNRRTVMDILLEHAKEHSHLQFVFLTPQDISSVIHDQNITVHRLEDPQRRNALL